MAPSQLPKRHRALVQHQYGQPFQVDDVPTPRAGAGNAIVQVLCANVISYMNRVYDGRRKYPYPTPLTPGFAAIGRVKDLGPDSTVLTIGQLVFVDPTIRGRDDPGAVMLHGLSGGFGDGSQKLMAGEWRNGAFAEYAKVGLENCIPLNETRLCGSPSADGCGYELSRLAYMSTLLVAFGGLRDIRLEAGETIIIAPATGGFGGAAVICALAMGARVIALGRNTDALARLKTLSKRVEIVKMTNNQDKDLHALKGFGQVDAFFDISPMDVDPKDITHLKSCILALRHQGRVSLMGGILGDMMLPYRTIMTRDIKIGGKWMNSREDAVLLAKMLEIGVLSLDAVNVRGRFPLERWKEAFDVAEQNNMLGDIVVIEP